MKIVEVLIYLSGGGAQRFTADLCNELSNTHDVTLLTLLDENKNPEDRQFGKSFLGPNVQYVNLGLANGFSLKNQLKVIKAIVKLKPDIVHLNGKPLTSYMFLAILLLPWKYRFIETIHNDLNNGYTSFLQKAKFFLLGNSKRIRFAALSRKNYEDFTRAYPHCNFSCIENGRSPVVPSEQFENVKQEIKEYKSSDKTMVFIHVARYAPIKNQSLLIDTFNNLIEEGYDVTLLILGGKFDCEEGSKLVKKSCEQIHFLGAKNNVADYMLNSDVFVLSSLAEGMPITLLEASLAGVPSVSTPVCGGVDIIQDGINGKLSEGFSQKEYKDAILYAIDNYTKIKKGAEDLKNNSNYTIEECANKYMAFFCE